MFDVLEFQPREGDLVPVFVSLLRPAFQVPFVGRSPVRSEGIRARACGEIGRHATGPLEQDGEVDPLPAAAQRETVSDLRPVAVTDAGNVVRIDDTVSVEVAVFQVSGLQPGGPDR